MQKTKHRRAALLAFAIIFALSLAVVSCIVVGVLRFSNPAAPLAKEQTMRTQSFDGKLTLVEEHVRINGVMVAQISVQNIAGETIYACPENYRVWDYYGTYWGNRTYDIWTLSSDTGMLRYAYENGTWNASLPQRPLPDDMPQEAIDYFARIHR